jgi:hypothetical protein
MLKMKTDALSSFHRNIAEVDKLVNFDKELLQIITLNIQSLHDHLKISNGDERFNGGRALTIINGIRDNETIRSKYTAIYNQAVVLLVSHFSSALGDLFRDAVSERLQSGDVEKLLAEDIKLTFGEMREHGWNLKAVAADLLIAKHDFTFQDMGSTVKAFKEFVGVVIERNEIMNNIIAAQACRHVIVHAGGRISEKAVRQVSGAKPRTLRNKLAVDELIQLTAPEIEAIKADMVVFVEKLAHDIYLVIGHTTDEYGS